MCIISCGSASRPVPQLPQYAPRSQPFCPTPRGFADPLASAGSMADPPSPSAARVDGKSDGVRPSANREPNPGSDQSETATSSGQALPAASLARDPVRARKQRDGQRGGLQIPVAAAAQGGNGGRYQVGVEMDPLSPNGHGGARIRANTPGHSTNSVPSIDLSSPIYRLHPLLSLPEARGKRPAVSWQH